MASGAGGQVLISSQSKMRPKPAAKRAYKLPEGFFPPYKVDVLESIFDLILIRYGCFLPSLC
jgi:hypothetical protein